MADNDRQTYLITFLIGFVPVIWLALLMAPYMNLGLIQALPYLTEAMNSPFSLTWCNDSLKAVMMFIVIYVCGIGIYLSSKKNYRRQKEYGSAK